MNLFKRKPIKDKYKIIDKEFNPTEFNALDYWLRFIKMNKQYRDLKEENVLEVCRFAEQYYRIKTTMEDSKKPATHPTRSNYLVLTKTKGKTNWMIKTNCNINAFSEYLRRVGSELDEDGYISEIKTF